MSHIAVLDQETINQIAAGEVIERPASVVKELIENAVDAKASTITAEIREGGIHLIRITDNGCGIAKEEVATAFLRHSTSKIRRVEDLLTVSSLGFRGEALSSIAAVAKVELLTKTRSSFTGVRYVIEGGKEKGCFEIGCPEGTTFLVRDLFYNLPARRKFLKTPTTEAGYVCELIERLAISHPEISFKFINNNKTVLHTSGNGNRKDAIYYIYGREIASQLLPVVWNEKGIQIEGFLGKPSISRSNRTYENYFINGRYIRSLLLYKTIEEAYQPYMMQHKYPFTVLSIAIDHAKIDVNVHPTKMELRFSEGDVVSHVVFTAIRETLLGHNLIPEVSLGLTSNLEPLETKETKNIDRVQESTDFVQQSLSLKPTALANQYRIIGQLFSTYWLIEVENQLWMIDQHAAHEKVLYEKTVKRLKEQKPLAQMLNPPVILSLSIREKEALLTYQTILEQLGFTIEPFGGKEYSVRSVPMDLFGLQGKEVLLEFIDTLVQEVPKEIDCSLKTSNLILERIASLSCKAAVKGNHRLSEPQAKALIDELMTLENPFHCPHGRPVIISMTKYEIEKKFKRVI